MRIHLSKGAPIILLVLGIPAVAYGMTYKHHPIFIAGLVFVAAAYLIIRKRLKG